MPVRLRLVEHSDAAVLARIQREDRAHLAPWEPLRGDSWATEEVQRREVVDALARYEAGRAVPCVILEDGELVGRMSVNDVVRGAFQSAHLGYWVASTSTGRGVATAAVAAAVRLAFDDLGLHRLQADTLVHNVASQRVLARNGFSRIGSAPRYLRIAGEWQDHLLHQRLAED